MTTEFVRIVAENGRAVSVNKDYVKGLDKKPTVLDADSLDVRGLPLPDSRVDGRTDKPRTTVKKAAAKKTASTTEK